MSQDDKDPPAPGNEESTVFAPGGTGDDGDEKTRFIAPENMPAPTAATPPAPPPPPPAPPVAEPAAAVPAEPPATPPSKTAMEAASAMPAPGQARRIQIGDVLNHTYEVRKFIARGGMGEVFEGVNVNAEDDRVAIKVMLPHLAADPLVQAMFSKEAKTLTRLRHPGLVQYRLLGREPQLGVTYIVTEFVDGVNLSDVLKTLETTAEDQLTLLKRLAAALGAAHELDAVHRDISPDNVLLEGGRLKDAKIIDFGIAKDLDAGAKTIVGDGFAGKLGYVAPEQLGSYGRSVGPWTDVYSLALVLLAVAQKKDVDMGGSLADAFDKRKDVPDLSAAPEELRPILTKMLQPDPANRLRSMDEVLQEVALQTGGGYTPGTRLEFEQAPAPKSKTPLIAGAAVALVAAAAGGWYLTRGPSDPQGAAQTALAAGLRNLQCSWLDVGSVQATDDTVDVALRGVSGKPDKAKSDITEWLGNAGLKAGDIDFSDVKQIDSTDCSPIDAFRQIRDYDSARLTVTKRQYEMSNHDGKLAADPEIEVDLNKLAGDVAVFGLEETGAITPLIMSQSEMNDPDAFSTPRPGVKSFKLTTDHKGWSGILLLKGKPPFDPELLKKEAGEVSPSWVNRFLSTAKAQGWKSEMIWYRTVDEKPG